MVRALGPEDEPTLYVSVGGLTNLAIAENGDCLFTRVSGGGLEAMAVDSPSAAACRWTTPATGCAASAWTPRPTRSRARRGSPRCPHRPDRRRPPLTGDLRASLDFHQSQRGVPGRARRLHRPRRPGARLRRRLERELGLPVEPRVTPARDAGVERLSSLPASPSRRCPHEGRQPFPVRPAARRQRRSG